jgi:Gas vesicle protein G
VGLIVGLLTLPLAPVRGVAWIADQVYQEAERQWSDPDAIYAELSAIQRGREEGSIDEAEADRREEELLQHLIATEQPVEPPSDSYGRPEA